MTVTEHTYTATVAGRALPVRGGQITLDAGVVPYVKGALDLDLPGQWVTEPDQYTPWAEQRRNLVPNPACVSTAGWLRDGAASTLAVANGTTPSGPGTNFLELKLTAATTSWRRVTTGDIPAGPDQVFSAGIWVRVSNRSIPVRLGIMEFGPGGWIADGWRRTVTLAAGWQFVSVENVPIVNPGTTRIRLAVDQSGAGALGDVLHIWRAQLEASPTLGSYLDGDTPSTSPLERYRWLGTPNASQSVWETREVSYHGGPVWVPAPDVLGLLDPRQSPPPRVVVTATEGGTVRAFDLHVRDRSIDHKAGTVQVALASDEALLDDYAPLADDLTPLAHRDSLRALVNYVLGEAIPGATLQPGPDQAVKVLSESSNLIRNGRAMFAWDWQYASTAGSLTVGTYPTGGPAGIPSYWYMGAAGGAVSGAEHYYAEGAVSVTGAEDYVLTVSTRHQAGVTVQIDAVIFDGSNNVIGFATPVTVPGNGAWKRSTVTFWTPPTAARVRPRVLVQGALPSGRYVDVTGWRLSKDNGDPADLDYFDDTTPDTADYEYTSQSDPWASPHVRTPLVDAATPAALTWKAGQSSLDLLHPLVQALGLRLVCDEARRWTLRDERYTAAGSVTLRHGINIVDATETISRDGSAWQDARATRYRWVDADGRQQERVDAFALTDDYTRMRIVDIDAPYPGPGRSEYAVRRAQGLGREVTVTTVADWTCAAEQPAQIQLEDTPRQSGSIQSVRFDLDRDEMTVTVRTLELGARSINSLTGTINALTGTINQLGA